MFLEKVPFGQTEVIFELWHYRLDTQTSFLLMEALLGLGQMD